jgi:NAD+ synthase (glutamine-hydrolysing)
MRLMTVAAACLNQTPLDWEGNLSRICDAIAEARRRGVHLLCMPELCITGYGCEDAFHAPNTYDRAWQSLSQIVPMTGSMVVSVGLPVLYNNGVYNTACLIADGEILGFVAKQHLAGDGIHYEPRWFKPWPAEERATLEREGASYCLGDIYFEVGGVRIGFEICEDAWVARRPGADLATKAVDVILNPSASHFAFGKREVRKRFVLEGSRAFGVTYVYANLLGNDSGRVTYDGGAMISSIGKLLAWGPRLSFHDVVVTDAVVDLDATRVDRIRTVSFTPTVETERADCIVYDMDFDNVEPRIYEGVEWTGWEASERLKEEEFTRAIALALHDYLRKSRAKGFVVSLSGGADSTAVAVLVALAVDLATTELGVGAFKKIFGYIEPLREAETAEEIVHALLLCCYQSTRNSSETTRHAASVVASAIGASFLELDVDSLVEQYTGLIEGAIGRKLSWDTDDLALQNIQARVRGPGIWMLTNIRQSLLLATSNRSEAAVGYATMDGDTCGGLSPIAGIDKAFLLRWLSWLETEGPHGGSAIPELRTVTVQRPTAELRPAAAEQTDESDLMPYAVLDAIERAAIRDKKTPVEVYRLMKVQFADCEKADLGAWIERFFVLWCRNQWKRERYAPSFHVDDENLDPKTWCRFPILSGGFRQELRDLREVLDSEVNV